MTRRDKYNKDIFISCIFILSSHYQFIRFYLMDGEKSKKASTYMTHYRLMAPKTEKQANRV